jgi:hypothetical protein
MSKLNKAWFEEPIGIVILNVIAGLLVVVITSFAIQGV